MKFPGWAAFLPRRTRDRAAPALAFVFVSIVLDMVAGNLASPVFPRFVRTISGYGMAGVTELFGAFMTVFYLIQLFAGPVQGALSDRFGRRPVILVSSFGLALDAAIMALAPNVTWLFVARVVAGAFAGGFAAAYAYVADITPPEGRAKRFGYIAAAMSTGLALGPIVGGFLGELSTRAPFWAAAALGIVSTAYGFAVLPESLPKNLRTRVSFSNLHPLGVVIGIWRDFPALRPFGTAFLLFNFGVAGANSIFAVYTTYRFGWGPKEIGFYITAVAVQNILVQSFLVSPVVRRLGEMKALIVGLVVQTAAMFAAGLAFNGLEFWLAVVVMIFGGFAGPAQSAILNGLVSAENRGRLSGAMRSLFSVASVAAPALFATLFAITGRLGAGSIVAGTPFYVAAGLTLVGTLVITLTTGSAMPGGKRHELHSETATQ